MPQQDLPKSIGRYEVTGLLGRGGMGVVYLGRDPRIGRPVAIKLLHVSDEELRARFLQEAQSAGNLKHPNIVTIYDFGEHEEQPFIVMEFVEGVTFAQQIHQNLPLSLPRKLELIGLLSTALDYAHNKGIVHRDIKPANIMVDTEGVLKILDFGIARVGDSGLTQAGVMIGTPNYMSPEQVDGRPVDRRSDIFAVGLVFYELLSYRQAFPGKSAISVLNAILRTSPPSLDQTCPGLHPSLHAIVRRAMEKDPSQRYQTLAALAADITLFKNRIWVPAAEEEQPTVRLPVSARPSLHATVAQAPPEPRVPSTLPRQVSPAASPRSLQPPPRPVSPPASQPASQPVTATPVASLRAPSVPRGRFGWKVGGALVAGMLIVAALWGVFRDRERPPRPGDARSALTSTVASTSVPPRDVTTTTMRVTTPTPIEPPLDTTRLATTVRALVGRGDLQGAAKTIADGLNRAPRDPVLAGASAEVLDAAAARADGFKQAAIRSDASKRAEYADAVNRVGSATRFRQADRVESAVGEYLTAARLFGEAAKAQTIAATTSVLPTAIPPTSVPVRPPVTPATTSVAAPSIDLATVEQLLRRYAAASRSFDVAAVQQIFPRLPNGTKVRMDALRKNFAYCDYSFTNVQILSSTATEAVARADSVESCKPKTGQKAFDTPSRQEFRLTKSSPGSWSIGEIFISQ